MAKYKLYRKDDTFEIIEARGTYVFYERTHQVYFPSIRAKIKNVFKVEEIKNAKSGKKKQEEKAN